MFSRLWQLIFVVFLVAQSFLYGRWFVSVAWPTTLSWIGTLPIADIIEKNDEFRIIRNVAPRQTPNLEDAAEVVLVTTSQDYKNRFAGEVRYELLPLIPREYGHMDPALSKIIAELERDAVIISQVPLELNRSHDLRSDDNIFVYTLL